MDILIIKTSSMGDVLHTFPAVCDARQALSNVHFDWIIEERYASIVQRHPAVERIFPIAWRRWRKHPIKNLFGQEFKTFRSALREKKYDFVIDAQGLIKSAALCLLARGLRCGYDRASIREPLASFVYQKRYTISRQLHAVTRIRQLFSAVLEYVFPYQAPNFGFDRAQFAAEQTESDDIVLIHGTTWKNKMWPENYWAELIRLLYQAGYAVKIAWGNEMERLRSLRLCQGLFGVSVLPELDINGVAGVLAAAKAVVAVDTGFAHLAEALDVPMVSIYGPTYPGLLGPVGARQRLISAKFPCAPCHKRYCYYQGNSKVFPACFATITPAFVYRELQEVLQLANTT